MIVNVKEFAKDSFAALLALHAPLASVAAERTAQLTSNAAAAAVATTAPADITEILQKVENLTQPRLPLPISAATIIIPEASDTGLTRQSDTAATLSSPNDQPSSQPVSSSSSSSSSLSSPSSSTRPTQTPPSNTLSDPNSAGSKRKRTTSTNNNSSNGPASPNNNDKGTQETPDQIQQALTSTEPMHAWPHVRFETFKEQILAIQQHLAKHKMALLAQQKRNRKKKTNKNPLTALLQQEQQGSAPVAGGSSSNQIDHDLAAFGKRVINYGLDDVNNADNAFVDDEDDMEEQQKDDEDDDEEEDDIDDDDEDGYGDDGWENVLKALQSGNLLLPSSDTPEPTTPPTRHKRAKATTPLPTNITADTHANDVPIRTDPSETRALGLPKSLPPFTHDLKGNDIPLMRAIELCDVDMIKIRLDLNTGIKRRGHWNLPVPAPEQHPQQAVDPVTTADALLTILFDAPLQASHKSTTGSAIFKSQPDTPQPTKPPPRTTLIEASVLSRHTIRDVRDCLKCPADYASDLKDDPNIGPGFACLMIEGVIYYDDRYEKSLTYAKALEAYIRADKSRYNHMMESTRFARNDFKRAGVILPDLEVKPMGDTKLEDLIIRLDAPYSYHHLGHCHHNMSLKDVRMPDARDDLNALNYPKLLKVNREYISRRCYMCQIAVATLYTLDDEQAPHNPCFLCDSCMAAFHGTDPTTWMFTVKYCKPVPGTFDTD